MKPRIESLLSARLFLVPQMVDDRIIFISNMSGHMSLYAMDHGGSVPEPLLPPNIVLQNPHLMGMPYYVFPDLGKIVLMLDDNGDENYQPMYLPLEGGVPEPAFPDAFEDARVFAGAPDMEENKLFLVEASHKEAKNTTYLADLESGDLIRLAESMYGRFADGCNDDYTKMIFVEGYSFGDNVLFYWEENMDEMRLLWGKPIDQREPGEEVPPAGISSIEFVDDDEAIIFIYYLDDDTGSIGYMLLARPDEILPVPITGLQHEGVGELEEVEHLRDDLYQLTYNIDGASWVYEARYDQDARELMVVHALVGQPPLDNGVLEAIRYDKLGDRYALSFSTATAPTQIYTLEGADRELIQHTRERILGLPDAWLSKGEDASYESFDGTRVSARLYLPSDELSFESPYPLVYYVHGGPQSQERPDFAWFSMPLIQFLTLNGFAVFVPNVRGSTGYGMQYMKQVDRDWGGKDRLDHVHAMTEVLPQDERIDTDRAAVVGRSCGGYMTLTLAARHPELWKASCDMFGPYDLVTFLDRIPETWKPYFKITVGDPKNEQDRIFLEERSPRTYFDGIGAPMLVIQGKNDPRVVEEESADVVEGLRARGKEVEYLMFENEGHDVLEFENRVRCYNAITDFFKDAL